MIRIGVVDDEETSRQIVLEHLARYRDDHGTAFSVRTFADGGELVRDYAPEFDIIFLDVQMTELDGLETARRIREIDSEVVIVFITNMAQYAIRGYEVDALSYLVKPVPYFAFSQELKRSIARVQRSDSESVLLSTGSGVARVALTDIVYAESIRHRIVVHAIGRTYAFSGTLKALEQELVAKGFFRSNNCYLVNLRHVKGVAASTCTMLGGIELQISRSRKRSFLQALTDHVGARLA